MPSTNTPSVLINPGSSTPTPPEENSARPLESPTKLDSQTGDYLGSSTLPKPPLNVLLKTPLASEGQLNQDKSYSSSYMSSRSSGRSTFRPTHNASPSEHLATSSCVSPGLSLNGSYQFSEHGLSLYSQSSSEYLSPPEFQADCDNPPYKPHREDAESLTMMKLRRAQTMPGREPHLGRRQHKKRRRCWHKRVKMFEHQDRSYWWLPGCQIAPTAPPGHQELCVGHTGVHIPQSTNCGNTDTFGRLHPVMKSFPAAPIISRRWSSVEIGAHKIPLETKLTLKSYRRKIKRRKATNNAKAPIDLGRRLRNSTLTLGAIEHDIIHAVRKRLTLREICPSPLNVPASITLRRASDSSGASVVGDIETISSPNVEKSWEPYEAQESKSLDHKRASAAYLITSRDIESITELIEAKLSRSLETSPRSRPSPSKVDFSSSRISHSSSIRTRSPTVNKAGTVTLECFPSEPVTNTTDHVGVEASQCALERFQALPGYKRKRKGHQRTTSSKPDQELIWQDNTSISPNSGSSVSDEDGSKPSPSFVCSEPGTPGRHVGHDSCETPQSRPQFMGKCGAFERQNVSSFVGEWQSNIVAVVRSSDDEVKKKTTMSSSAEAEFGASTASPGSTTRPKIRPFLRYRASANQVQDVESFPPLPRRKATADWFSPLPEMETYSPLMTPRSHHETGPSSKELTPKASQMSWARSALLSPSKNVEFNWNVDYRPKTPELTPAAEIRHTSIDARHEDFRRKSTVKAHPCSPARTGSPSSIGSSIGVSHHERRRSLKPRSVHSPHAKSMPLKTSPPDSSSGASAEATVDPIKRVRTIDNIDKRAHRSTCARWRPPSICPSPRTPSPSEECEYALEEGPKDPEPSQISTETQPSQLQRIRSVFMERMNSIREISPPSVKLDPIGIYGQLTGTRSADNRNSGHVWGGGDSHECDDAANHPGRTPSVDWIG